MNEIAVEGSPPLPDEISDNDHVRVEDGAVVGPGVTFQGLDSDAVESSASTTLILRGSSVGEGSVIQRGVAIGPESMVMSGSVVMSSVPPFCKVSGNPAVIVSVPSATLWNAAADADSVPPTIAALVLPRVIHSDRRGQLFAIESGSSLPFPLERVFFTSKCRKGNARGVHAHKETHQALFAIRGTFHVLMVSRDAKMLIEIEEFGPGLHVEPMTWTTLIPQDDGAELLACASRTYDPDDYIHSFSEFEEAIRLKGPSARMPSAASQGG